MNKNIRFVNLESLTDEQLNQMAVYDNAIPALYDPSYTTNEQDDKNRVELYKNLPKPFFFQVAFLEDDMIGFHILQALTIESKRLGARIMTLWTHPLHRGKGIARELKSNGIEWARNEQMTSIQTGVHATNTRMQEINKKNGYDLFAVVMRMKL